MADADPFFDRESAVEALTVLGGRLAARGLVGEVYLVGGAAMVLAYHSARFTKDIDAVFAPTGAIYQVAAEMVEELGLPRGWLNDAARSYVPGADPRALPVLDVPGLRVTAASAEHLLGMKLLAARPEQDREDVIRLAAILGLSTPKEVLGVVERMYPPEMLLPRTRFLVNEMFNPPSGDPPLDQALG
ncbi:MAG: DUF6036 family nucleotidyltransferase, partial [Candidatus Dormiibacterota bacterium]